MKKIKIDFVDFWDGFDKYNNFITDVLKTKYELIISEQPDYIFYSNFGFQHLNVSCVRIYFSGENIVPDFNICDYAIGFHEIEFEDRYLRYPLYMLYVSDFKLALNKHEHVQKDINSRKFCNFIYSNSKASIEREIFFNELSKYKDVDSGGKLFNNIGYYICDKIDFMKDYKFSIAFENSMTNGYITEKILHAFSAKTIPIYWGSPNISKYFNSKSFINAHDFKDFHDLIKKIILINDNQDTVRNYLLEPMFNDKQLKYHESLIEKFRGFLFHIFDQDLKDCMRRNNTFHGLYYQNNQIAYAKTSKSKIFKVIKRFIIK